MFKNETISKLTKFSNAISEKIVFGIEHGLLGLSGKADTKAEVKEFLRKYTREISAEFGVNVANILKTPKQLKFVCQNTAAYIDSLA